MIDLDARRQKHREVLGLKRGTKLHWSKGARTYEVQKLSSFHCPIRYRVTTADGWYTDAEGERVHYTPGIRSSDPYAKVCEVAKRAVVVHCVIG